MIYLAANRLNQRNKLVRLWKIARNYSSYLRCKHLGITNTSGRWFQDKIDSLLIAQSKVAKLIE